MMRENIKKLWKLCFNDSDDFVEMYFRLRYNKETNRVIESGKEVIAALQTLPYPMTFCGTTVSTEYISGACTHPDFRNRGVMSELLSQTLGRMYHHEIMFTTLIPGEPCLFDYYRRLGYATVFQYGKRIFHPSANEPIIAAMAPDTSTWEVQASVQPDKSVYQYLNQKLRERTCCVQHTEEDFQVILADLQLIGGHVYTLLQEQKPAGVAMVYPGSVPSVLHIDELVTDSPEAEQWLLTRICQDTQAETLEIITAPDEADTTYPLGMARIITPKAVLQLYATVHPEAEMNITLVDEQLSANNGHYYLNNGKCMFSHKRLPGAHSILTIGQLTELVLATEHPTMGLMLN